jgi:two-component system sensor histidine kinase/response regulator
MTETDNVLVVDDHTENLVALEALLAAPGVAVHTAPSGRDALELVLRNEYAVAILDVSMPELDGFALAELMRGTRRSRTVPIIFVTAGPREPGRMFQGYEAGAVDFLFKPLDAGVLRAKVGVFLELHRQRRELASRLREREALVARLREELRLNETFAAVLAHDLRTPLSAILGSAEIVVRTVAADPGAAAARRIRSSARRMTRMIEELLDFARARVAGGIPLTPRAADLGHILAKVKAEVEAGGTADIRIEVEGALDGTWDRDRLAQVLSNLVGNAVRHGEAGAPVRVAVDGTAAERVRIAVHNAGCIPADVLPVLFEPFRGGRPGAAGDAGIGLGLFIVRHIVEGHGGTVEGRSSGADGTTFVVTLPRAAARGEPAPAAPGRASAAPG